MHRRSDTHTLDFEPPWQDGALQDAEAGTRDSMQGNGTEIQVPVIPVAPERLMVDAAHLLATDIAAAHGLPRPADPGLAQGATVLWSRFLRFDAADPTWPDRDRVVLLSDACTPLLLALLHLTGHAGIDAELLRTPPSTLPHPFDGMVATPDKGLGTALGLALGERLLAARFGKSVVDHRIWALAAGADLMDGACHEAASLAGHLRLSRLTVLWDAAEGEPGSSDDTLRHFLALGWAVKQVVGGSPVALGAALSLALRSKKPTLIACTGAPQPVAPISGRDTFVPAAGAAAAWDAAGHRGSGARRAWLKRMQRHPLRADFERAVAGRLPEGWQEPLSALKAELLAAGALLSTAETSARVAVTLAGAVPELIGSGLGDPPATLAPVVPGAYAGRYVPCGPRPQVLAEALHGQALHAGLLPWAQVPLAATDRILPALRLAAQSRQRVVHLLCDAPTPARAAQLASLRALRGVAVFHPADPIEAAECWELALRRQDGPTLLVVSGCATPVLREEAGENRCARGGYVLAEADGPRRATLLASGAEVAAAMQARAMLAELGIPSAVVSLPCWTLFADADPAYRDTVLGGARRFGIEAQDSFGWERWLGQFGDLIGSDASQEPCTAGPVPEAIVMAVQKRLAAE